MFSAVKYAIGRLRPENEPPCETALTEDEKKLHELKARYVQLRNEPDHDENSAAAAAESKAHHDHVKKSVSLMRTIRGDASDEEYESANEEDGARRSQPPLSDKDRQAFGSDEQSSNSEPTTSQAPVVNSTDEITLDSAEKILTETARGKVGVRGGFGLSERDARVRHTEFRENYRSKTHILPGERAYTFNKHLPGRMKGYNIPDRLWTAIENHTQISTVFPELIEDLTTQSYTRKFCTLIWCEEAAQILEMRRYDLVAKPMYRCNDYLALSVPGLSDGRPSIISGDRVLLNNPDVPSIFYEGYVHYVRKDDVLLKFHRNFQEDYKGELYSVSFHSSRTTIKRMQMAVEAAPTMGKHVLFPNESEIVEKHPFLRTSDINQIDWINKVLNERQKLAVINVLRGTIRPSPYLIYGPPGTGKTVTLVEAIIQTYRLFPKARILACSVSNAASDLIAIKLVESGVIAESDISRLVAHSRWGDVPEELKNISCKEDSSVTQAWLAKRILITTCSQAGCIYRYTDIRNAERIKPDHFTHLFIDEAAQTAEPEVLIPISLVSIGGGVTCLAGDPLQLGPVITSKTAKRFRLDVPLMCRLMELDAYDNHMGDGHFLESSGYNPKFITKLINNYRSDASIMAVSNELFYGKELKYNFEINKEALKELGFESCVYFHGLKGQDLRDSDCPSWYNPAEIVQTVKYVAQLYGNEVPNTDIGIITPYRKQVEKMRIILGAMGLELPTVATIEEFQGCERNVIIISTVRCNQGLISQDKEFNLGFIFNERRINVALSRAKALLIVIGDPDVLVADNIWCSFMDYCLKLGSYIGAKPGGGIIGPNEVTTNYGHSPTDVANIDGAKINNADDEVD